MAQFDYTKYLKQGGVEKYLMEANFGNDLQSRYDYIRPLMSRLPDSARTETFIDGMEDGLREDDKELFDYYFVEAMKALGLEQELMEPEDAMSEPDYEDYAPDSALGPNPSFVEESESLINPEAEEIDAEDLDAAADYFDSLAENDDVLDEILDEDVPLGIAPPFAMGDLVYRKFDDKKAPMKVVGMRKMFASPLHAVSVVGTSGGDKLEYDETQLVKLEEMEGEVQSEEVTVKPGVVQKGNVVDAIKLLNHIQYEYADAFSDESMDKVSDVIVMLNQVMKQQ